MRCNKPDPTRPGPAAAGPAAVAGTGATGLLGGTYYDRQLRTPPPAAPAEPPRHYRNRQEAEAPEPLLTVYADSRCFLSKALLTAVSVRAGAAVQVVVPAQKGGEWFLDTHPRPGAGRALPSNPAARGQVRLPPVARHHFLVARPIGAGQGEGSIRGNRNDHLPQLRFRLGPEMEGHPGYYRLLPLSAAGPVHRNGQAGPGVRQGGG